MKKLLIMGYIATLTLPLLSSQSTAKPKHFAAISALGMILRNPHISIHAIHLHHTTQFTPAELALLANLGATSYNHNQKTCASVSTETSPFPLHTIVRLWGEQCYTTGEKKGHQDGYRKGKDDGYEESHFSCLNCDGTITSNITISNQKYSTSSSDSSLQSFK